MISWPPVQVRGSIRRICRKIRRAVSAVHAIGLHRGERHQAHSMPELRQRPTNDLMKRNPQYNDERRQLLEERQNKTALQPTEDDPLYPASWTTRTDFAISRLIAVTSGCLGAFTAPTSMAVTCPWRVRSIKSGHSFTSCRRVSPKRLGYHPVDIIAMGCPIFAIKVAKSYLRRLREYGLQGEVH